MNNINELTTYRSRSHYSPSQLSSNSGPLNQQYDEFVNKIYGKTKQIKIHHLIPKQTNKVFELSTPQFEDAIYKKMDDYIKNEKLSQRETRIQERIIEKEIIQQYKEKQHLFKSQIPDQNYIRILKSCQNYIPKFKFTRFNSPNNEENNQKLLTRASELLQQRKQRYDIYKKQLEYERKKGKKIYSTGIDSFKIKKHRLNYSKMQRVK
ncbi:unnamed protein product (macronuclear) [Paramecium tetraurelia]|uniref:Fcf2 pre-rRNA processing C-terminal domain-containing protein n=1 Tax=Paramecium tetraurelia TaxID=5888 RepID=A0C6V4_PARTE|nr:uncharacterized protein GSPATT00035650001 [Paramecium tetraurelia]CAK66521.1 unnamed protein product [Paramecium tetraurelia]|eukprot:XP_001433918.1 hypothetical protein (macronuclear) [Paramecium tetraurelia strain d4-2]